MSVVVAGAVAASDRSQTPVNRSEPMRDIRGPRPVYHNVEDHYQMNHLVASRDPNDVPSELEHELQQWPDTTGDLFEDTDYYRDLIDPESELCLEPVTLARG